MLQNQSEVQSMAESQVSQKSYISKQNQELIKKIELNEDDKEFLKFLEAKLKNTEKKIETVKNNIKQSSVNKAESINKDAENVLRNSTFNFKKQDVKGSLEENYIELYTQHKKLEIEMKKMVGKFTEKNNQINLLITELKRSKQSEELCIKKIADLTLKLERYESGNQTPQSQVNGQVQVIKKARKKTQLNSSKQYSQSITNQYQVQQNNSGFHNKLDENLQKQDKYNFWLDDQQKQEEKAVKIKAINKNKHTLDDVLNSQENGELWLHQHNLRRNYRENQEQQLAQKYGQNLQTDEQQQQMMRNSNSISQQSQSGTPSIRTPQQSQLNLSTQQQGITMNSNKNQLRPLDVQPSHAGTNYKPKRYNQIYK